MCCVVILIVFAQPYNFLSLFPQGNASNPPPPPQTVKSNASTRTRLNAIPLRTRPVKKPVAPPPSVKKPSKPPGAKSRVPVSAVPKRANAKPRVSTQSLSSPESLNSKSSSSFSDTCEEQLPEDKTAKVLPLKETECQKKTILQLEHKVREHGAALKDRDAILKERNVALEERDAILKEHDAAVEEHEAALKECKAVFKAQDASIANLQECLRSEQEAHQETQKEKDRLAAKVRTLEAQILKDKKTQNEITKVKEQLEVGSSISDFVLSITDHFFRYCNKQRKKMKYSCRRSVNFYQMKFRKSQVLLQNCRNGLMIWMLS
jgi:hypothetical protein